MYRRNTCHIIKSCSTEMFCWERVSLCIILRFGHVIMSILIEDFRRFFVKKLCNTINFSLWAHRGSLLDYVICFRYNELFKTISFHFSLMIFFLIIIILIINFLIILFLIIIFLITILIIIFSHIFLIIKKNVFPNNLCSKFS